MTVAASIAASGVRPTSCTARAIATSNVRVEPAIETSSGEPRDAVGDLNVQVAEAVSPVTGACGCHRVADQSHPSGSQPAEHPNHLRSYVDTVIDHLQPNTGVLDEREHWPGRTMMHARHRVEGVSEQGRPRIDRRPGLLERRRRVTGRDDDTRLPQDPRRLGEVSPLRRHRDLAQSAVGRAQQLLNQVRIGVAKQRRIVRPAILAGQKWALEVDPEDRGVSPGLGRRDLNLGDQIVG